MAETPLVTVIVPTRNSARTLEVCLKSIRSQTYPAIELIVVDNHSTDATQEIARRFADRAVIVGPERSAQRNEGAKQAEGEYLAMIDSDMVLEPEVISACVAQIADASVAGVVIPEESFGEGFWAQCKGLERSFYVGVPWMEGARFFRKRDYAAIGGYDELLVSGEDWDLSQRVEKIGRIARVDAWIRHDEGRLRLIDILHKKWYYAGVFVRYRAKHQGTATADHQTSIISRYGLFFSKPRKLFADPLLGFGMLFMKTCEFGCGALATILRRK